MTHAENGPKPQWERLAELFFGPISVVAVGGAIFYMLLTLGYTEFYTTLGVPPGDVGINYSNTISNSTGAVLLILAALTWTIVGGLWGRQDFRTKWKRNWKRILISVIVYVLLMTVILPFSGYIRATAVKEGRAVLPAHRGPFVILAIHAEPATIQPKSNGAMDSSGTSYPADGTGIAGLEGKKLMYLGQANSTAVFYDSDNQQVVRVPTADIILRVSNCRPRKSDDPACKRAVRSLFGYFIF